MLLQAARLSHQQIAEQIRQLTAQDIDIDTKARKHIELVNMYIEEMNKELQIGRHKPKCKIIEFQPRYAKAI